jgi:predicted metalloendopeptidase
MLAWSTVKELSELRKMPERDVWLEHPAIVNAWYSPNHNTISKYLTRLFSKLN